MRPFRSFGPLSSDEGLKEFDAMPQAARQLLGRVLTGSLISCTGASRCLGSQAQDESWLRGSHMTCQALDSYARIAEPSSFIRALSPQTEVRPKRRRL